MPTPITNDDTKTQELFQEAVSHRDQGKYSEALKVLQSIERELWDAAGYLVVLGDTYWELGKLERAIKVFRHAAEIAPTSETVSIGLFLCLWESDDTDAAFDEMRRFFSVADSEEYRRLLADINSLDKSKKSG